jgi:hypothetical protein
VARIRFKVESCAKLYLFCTGHSHVTGEHEKSQKIKKIRIAKILIPEEDKLFHNFVIKRQAIFWKVPRVYTDFLEDYTPIFCGEA